MELSPCIEQSLKISRSNLVGDASLDFLAHGL